MYRIKVCLAVFVFTWKDWARLAQLSFKFPAEDSLPVIFSSMAERKKALLSNSVVQQDGGEFDLKMFHKIQPK